MRTTDTDVGVLAVANAQNVSAREIWIAFGVGKHFRYIPVHDIAQQLGPSVAKALPFSHSFTGSDTVSFFAGKGKKKAWEVWQTFPQVTEVFISLADGPDAVTDAWMETLERFVNRTSTQPEKAFSPSTVARLKVSLQQHRH